MLIPAFVLLTVYGYLGAALAVFFVAGATDAVDGLIARLTSHPTSFGAWLDPMADKLLLVSTFVVLTLPQIDLTNHVPLWLTILVISRDIVIVSVVAIVNLAVGPRTFKPSLLGKAATATFIVANGVIMYFNWRMEKSPLVDATSVMMVRAISSMVTSCGLPMLTGSLVSAAIRRRMPSTRSLT